VNCLIHSGYNYRVEAGDVILDLAERRPEHIWNRFLPKDERGDIRYYDGCGVSLDFARRESDYADFFNLYQESMQRQGYTSISHDFFKNLRLNLGDQFRVILFTSENNVIAGNAILCDTKMSVVRLSLVGYRPLKSTKSFMPYIFWRIVNWASENGFKYLNFGRSSPDPTDHIRRGKQHFGGEFVPEYKFVLPVNSKEISFARSVLRVYNR
jgi:lipid II:glycine glycyltransferase (peptidoglycan interpeptide bridge formation enzyme)